MEISIPFLPLYHGLVRAESEADESAEQSAYEVEEGTSFSDDDMYNNTNADLRGLDKVEVLMEYYDKTTRSLVANGEEVISDGALETFLKCEGAVVIQMCLADCSLTHSSIRLLADHMYTLGALMQLDLSKNAIGTRGVQRLTDALMEGNIITNLNLSDNNIDDRGAAAIVKGLDKFRGLRCEQCGRHAVQTYDSESIFQSFTNDKSFTVKESGPPASARLKECIHCGPGHFLQFGTDPGAYATLKILNLSFNEIGDSGTIALARSLRPHRKLGVLILSSNRIGPEGAKALGAALEVNKVLHTLDLSSNGIGKQGCIDLCELLKNASLKTLDLGYNTIIENVSGSGPVGDEGASACAEMLLANTSLTSLCLESSDIGDNGAHTLAEALKRNTQLKSLALGRNSIYKPGTEAIEASLEVNFTLEGVTLSPPELSDVGKRIVATRTVTHLEFLSSPMSLATTRLLATAVRKTTHLYVLELSGQLIGVDGLAFLATSLRNNKTLKSLNLHKNGLGDAGMELMADSSMLRLNKSLTFLSLSDNSIGPAGIADLMSAVRGNRILAELDLSYNSLGNEGAELLDGLKETAVCWLTIKNTGIGEENMVKIGRIIAATRDKDVHPSTDSDMDVDPIIYTLDGIRFGLPRGCRHGNGGNGDDTLRKRTAMLKKEFVLRLVRKTHVASNLAAVAAFSDVSCLDYVWGEMYEGEARAIHDMFGDSRIASTNLAHTIESAIGQAVKHGSLSVLRRLYELIDEHNIVLDLPLDPLSQVAFQYGGMRMAKFFQDRGASPFVKLTSSTRRRNTNGITETHKNAKKSFNFGGVRLTGTSLEQLKTRLLDRTDQLSRTPLDVAASYGILSNVRQMLGLLPKHELAIDYSSNQPSVWTPLHEAAFEGHSAVVEYLLDNSIFQLSEESPHRRTALELCVEGERLAASRQLLEADDGNTYLDPLHKEDESVSYQDTRAVLLKHGAKARLLTTWIPRYFFFVLVILFNALITSLISCVAIVYSFFSPDGNIIATYLGAPVPVPMTIAGIILGLTSMCLPLLLSLVPAFNHSAERMTMTLAMFGVVVVGLLLTVTVSASRNPKFIHSRMRPPASLKLKRPLRHNRANAISLTTMFLQCYQLVAYSFVGNVLFKDMQTVIVVADLAFFDVEGLASFSVAVSLVIVWVILAAYLQASVVLLRGTLAPPWMREYFAWLPNNVVDTVPGGDIIMPLLADTFFLAIVRQLSKPLRCLYPEDGGAPVSMVQGLENLECWEGRHKVMALVGMIALVYYLLSSSAIGIFFFQGDNPYHEVRWIEYFVLTKRMLMVLLTIMTLLLRTQDYARLATILLVDVVFVVQTLRLPREDHLQSMVLLRASLYLMAAWAAVSNLIGMIVRDSGDDSLLPPTLALVLSGGGCLAVAVLAFAFKRRFVSTVVELPDNEEKAAGAAEVPQPSMFEMVYNTEDSESSFGDFPSDDGTPRATRSSAGGTPRKRRLSSNQGNRNRSRQMNRRRSVAMPPTPKRIAPSALGSQ